MGDSGQCIDPIPGRCPSVQVEVSWDDWAKVHILCPLVIQAILTLVFLLFLHPLYVEAYYRGNALPRCLKAYLGTEDNQKVLRPVYLVSVCALQQVTTLASLCIWVWHTYKHETTSGSRLAFFMLACFDCLTWTVWRIASGFNWKTLWEANAVVDVLTAVPVFWGAAGHSWGVSSEYDAWLSLHFLRSYSALYSFEKARDISNIDFHTAGLTQVMIQMVLRVVALLTVMAGITFTIEILGDPETLQDSFIETSTGDQISFLQMIYYIVVSITTVGYGDFAPRTVIMRVLTIVFIVVGVASVYMIQFTFSEMWKKQQEGVGKYWTQGGHDRHVVVILCNSGGAWRMSSLLHGFLQELLHPTHNELEDHHDHASSAWSHLRLWIRGRSPAQTQTWPDVVFLSPTKWNEGEDCPLDAKSFRQFLESTEDFPTSMLNRIWFLVGNINSEATLARTCVKDSALTYILSDLTSPNAEEDDALAIYTALIVRKTCPNARLRVMLLKPESKELAVQAGIDATRCFSSRELSACILAQNVRCRGLISAICSMLKSVDEDDEIYFLRQMCEGTDPCHPGRRRNRNTNSPIPRKANGMRKNKKMGSMEDLDKYLRNTETRWNPKKQAYERADPWMFEYFEGALAGVYGFDLHARFEGMSYGKFAFELFKQTGAIILGVQINGRLQVCPQSEKWTAREGQVCIALTKKPCSLDPFRCDPEDRISWRTRFQNSRKRRRNRTVQEGRTVDVARLMGRRLQTALMAHWQGDLDSPSRMPSPTNIIANSSSTPSAPRHKRGVPHVFEERVESQAQEHLVRVVSGESAAALSARSISFADDPNWKLKPRRSDVSVANSVKVPKRLRPPELNSEDDAIARLDSSVNAAIHESCVRGVMQMRENLSDWEDFIVVIACGGDIWPQLRAFCNSLRQDYLPQQQPIVILSSTTPPPGFDWINRNRIKCVQGSCLRAQTLIEVGVLEASTVVVLGGGASAHKKLPDYRVVLTGQELECWLASSTRESYVTFEMHESATAWHLPPLRVKIAGQRTKIAEMTRAANISRHPSYLTEVSMHSGQPHDRSDEEEELSPSPTAPEIFPAGSFNPGSFNPGSPVNRGLYPGSSWDSELSAVEEIQEDEPEDPGISDQGHRKQSWSDWFWSFAGHSAQEKSHDSICFNPRFASGQVFTPELWGLMLGRMFYMPAVIEIIEALVMPSRRGQTAFPWQLRVPQDYIGSKYIELYEDLVNGSFLDETMDDNEIVEDLSETPQQQWPPASPRQSTERLGPPAVPIGLYRLRADFGLDKVSEAQRVSRRSLVQHRTTAQEITAQNDLAAEILGGHRFLVLAPAPNMTVQAGDWVTVVGGREFGRRMHDKGLLRGSQPVALDE